jgi:UPF0716 protein FxsA
MLLVAGVLLVTPGFVTDILGLSLLIPSVRTAIAEHVQKHIKVNQYGAGATFTQGGAGNVYQHEPQEQSFTQDRQPLSHHDAETLEGEFQRKD